MIGDEEHGVHGALRRFEVFGTRGSAIIVEPFVPGHRIKLCLDESRDGFVAGEQIVDVTPTPMDQCYRPYHLVFFVVVSVASQIPSEQVCDLVDMAGLELEAFIASIRGEEVEFPLSHELLVQECLLRMTGVIDDPADQGRSRL